MQPYYDVNSTFDFSVVQPINLALLTQFFDQEKVSNLLGYTTFPKQVTLKVPDFKLDSHNMTIILVADQEQHLSLTKMARVARKDEQIFKTLTEPLLTGDIQLQSEWPDTNAIFIFISLGIGIFFIFHLCILISQSTKNGYCHVYFATSITSKVTRSTIIYF